ncbi:MAG TPA: membrane protein insertase YidC [Xanthobacteraceae bacterium]|nr:membrane protein insertase YidC [Xanthobacteraceae bacterium]
MDNQKNTIIAIALSALILIAWQYYFGAPQWGTPPTQLQPAAQQAPQQSGSAPQAQPTPNVPGQQPASAPPQPAQSAAAPAAGTAAQPRPRSAVLAETPRVPIATPSLHGSISLKGGRIDDVSLVQYHETVDPSSPPIILFSPSGTHEPYYAEFGWVAGNSQIKVPGSDTMWRQENSGALDVGHPVNLVYDNGAGLQFHRTIAIDDRFLFTVTDKVVNTGAAPVTLYPYGLISRHGTPQTAGYYILHEGLIGVMGDDGLQEIKYSDIEKKKEIAFDVTNAWLGITDKYWAATLLPNTTAHLHARFSSGAIGDVKTYQTDYLLDPVTVAPGGNGSTAVRLFAGAKQVAVINRYNEELHLNRFDLMIDWGWFYFITKPVFWTLDWLYKLIGNFGIAILIVTVVVKALFFPLANKSYASMAKMKAVQPELAAIRERYADDKMKQQQAMMELYKKEKINPVAGCLPIAIQIPVFFSLYKVLFITIEMRHAPFFGWIHDLSAPDPTNVFNLFGLIPFDPTVLPVVGAFLHLGAWPLIMGISMWLQMKLNPTPPDPTQKAIFAWMPLIFTFMLAKFPAGLVIYWAWNNTLSVIQQTLIMRKHGAKIELLANLKEDLQGIGRFFRSLFGKKKTTDA